MMKKSMIQKQPCPENLNDASSSSTGISLDDREINCTNAISKQRYILVKISASHCLTTRLDLNYARMAMAEMVGTFILMFCVCGIISSTQLQNGQVGLLEYAATAGLTVVVVIFSIGPISCAHVNPAATIAFATFGQFPWLKVQKKQKAQSLVYFRHHCYILVNNFISFSFLAEQVPVYILAQMVGSVSATYIGCLVYGIKSDVMMTRPIQGAMSAFWVELIATFIIMFLAAACFRGINESCKIIRASNSVMEIQGHMDIHDSPHNWSFSRRCLVSFSASQTAARHCFFLSNHS